MLYPWRVRASDISRKKRQNFAGFSGANSWKNRPISRDFRGKKVKICGKIGRFLVFLQEKSQNIHFQPWFISFKKEKSQISKDFQRQILRKIGRFHGKFRGGNFAMKQSVKNSRFRWILGGKFR